MIAEAVSLLILLGALMGLNLLIEERNEAVKQEDKDDEEI